MHYEISRPRGVEGLELGFHCEARDKHLNRFLLDSFRRHLFEIKVELGESVEAEMWDRGWIKDYEVLCAAELTEEYQEIVRERTAEIIVCLHPIFVQLRNQVYTVDTGVGCLERESTIMKTFLLILLIGMALALVACAPGSSEGLCDAEEGPCIGVRFDGGICTVEGPTEMALGEYTLVFANESEGAARVEIARLNSGWTLEDLVEDTADRPTGSAPDWALPTGLWNTIVAAGEAHTYHPVLGEAADYGILCFQIPQYAIYGDGFTLEG